MFVRKIQGVYATLLQKAYRGHRDRLRVHYMKHFPTSMETPIARLMRIAAIQPGCTWLASRSMANKQYLHDAFEGDIIVSETNSIGSKEAKLIASLLFTNKTVKMLILKNGNIDDDGFTSLINAFTFNNCMETFAFGPNNITSKGVEALGSALKDHNLKIKNLILEGNPLDNTASKLLGGAIGDFFYRNYGQLQFLSVCNASLTDKTGMYFANSLYMGRMFAMCACCASFICFIILALIRSCNTLLRLCLVIFNLNINSLRLIPGCLSIRFKDLKCAGPKYFFFKIFFGSANVSL